MVCVLIGDAGPEDAAFSCICDDGYVGKRTEQEQLNVCFDLFKRLVQTD